MINQSQALSAAIKAALTERHRALLLNGYDSLERLSHQLDDMEHASSLKIAVGQDWASYENCGPNTDVNEIHSDLCEFFPVQIPDMLIVGVIPGFDSKQRRQWAVTYSLRYAESMYSVSAKLSQWYEPSVRILGWPLSLPRSRELEDDIEEAAEETQDQAILRLQHVIYDQITKMHERHISCGYSRQKDAYQRFVNASTNQGYLVSGSERFEAVSTEASFGELVDPEGTEEAFRETWALPMSEISLLTAEYFPTEDGLDRWYVVYQLGLQWITLNIFVKFYPYRRPQVEIVGS